MHGYLRRSWGVVALATLATAAYLLAQIVNQCIAAALDPVPEVVVAGRRAVDSSAAWSLKASALGALFGIHVSASPRTSGQLNPNGPGFGGRGTPERTADCASAVEPVRTELRLQLLATMVANEPLWSTALIVDVERRESSLYRVGDPIRGAVVCAVVRDPSRVIISNGLTHRVEYVDLASPAGTRTTPTLADTLPGASPKYRVQRLSDTERVIPRDAFDAAMADLGHIMTEVRAVPSVRDGQVDGFKLFGAQPDSIMSELGLQNGDVVRSVNGIDLRSPKDAFDGWATLQTASSYQLVVERAGRTVTMGYDVR
jgi:general secretion pathway protein C